MLLILLLLFCALPFVELMLLVRLWEAIGLLPTLMIALGTGALGATLARQQGLATLARISSGLSQGEPPTDALVDGAMILLAGAVLITPGVLTDAFGFALLVPPVRQALKPLLRLVFRRMMRRAGERGATVVWHSGQPPAERGDVIDVEVTEVRSRDPDA